MPNIVSAQNACYYKCDKLLEDGVKEQGEYKSVEQITTQMKAQIHDDLEVRRKANLTGPQKALIKKEGDVARTKAIQEVVKASQAVAPAPAPAPAPVAPVPKGAGIENDENNDLMKSVMKNKSKSIIQKLMAKETKKASKLGKPIKGAGLLEV